MVFSEQCVFERIYGFKRVILSAEGIVTVKTVRIVMLAVTALASCMVWSQSKPARRPRVPVTGPARGTSVSIEGGRWLIDREVTYPGTAAEGLLMNLRVVNAVFEDPGLADFDPDANTGHFISKIPAYVASGIRAFTVNLQGGFPGYEGARNSAFDADGLLRQSYMDRVRRVADAASRNRALLILGCFYQRQDQSLRDEAAVKSGLLNVAAWVKRGGYTNILIEVANEYNHPGFDHSILKTASGQAELIRMAQQRFPCMLISTSGLGDGKMAKEIAEIADYMLVHFNSTPVEQIPARIAALKSYGIPIVCNEDDKVGEEGAAAAASCVASGASWGFMHSRKNQYYPFAFDGVGDDPRVYAKIEELTGSRPAVSK